MIKTSKYWVEKLDLEKHPEGGWFKEVYRSDEKVSETRITGIFPNGRNFSTSIYYLLEGNDFSAFHRIKSDEIWHFYNGNSPVEIVSIEDGEIKTQLLGGNLDEDQMLQYVVPKNTWFAARIFLDNSFALVGCTVSPGFHFDDFELAGKELGEEYPKLKKQISSFIRS